MTYAAVLESDPMSATFGELQTADFFGCPTVDDDIHARVCELLLATQQAGNRLERRSDRRYPYPYLVRLSPVASDGRTPCGPTIVVAGKSLSEGGFGFYHPQPLSHRRMIASFHVGNGRWVGFLIDLPWCRFTAEGWYESGARLLQAVPAVKPVASTATNIG